MQWSPGAHLHSVLCSLVRFVLQETGAVPVSPSQEQVTVARPRKVRTPSVGAAKASPVTVQQDTQQWIEELERAVLDSGSSSSTASAPVLQLQSREYAREYSSTPIGSASGSASGPAGPKRRMAAGSAWPEDEIIMN